MNINQVAYQLREQIKKFSGIISPRFSKPESKFMEQMIFGIQASQDVKLSSIARSLGEKTGLKKVVERLENHLKKEGFDQRINEEIAQAAARQVRTDTLIVVDPTDIRKPYARSMPYLGKVRDGSTGEIVNGYWGCVAIACEPERRRVIPLHQRLWSCSAPGFVSENEQIISVVDTIRQAIGERGVYVIDRGGDRNTLYYPLLERKLRFIIRLVGTRDLVFHGSRQEATQVGAGCPMNFKDTIIKEDRDGEKHYDLEYGFRPVKLPDRDEQLYLVVVKGFGTEPLLLLTAVALTHSRRSLWFVVRGYLARWMVEETIRFIKQSYHLEDIRVLDYQRLKNLMALVLAAAYFSAVWLGETLKLAVLCTRVARVAKRFFGVPDFHYYALADGISVLLSKLGRWTVSNLHQNHELDTGQLIFAGIP